MEKEKKDSISGVRLFKHEGFPEQWEFFVQDKDGNDLISASGFKSQAEARERIKNIRKVFRNRFMPIITK